MKFISFTRFVFVFFTIRLLVDGMEEFFIQPTALYYVDYLGGSHLFLGILLGAFSFSALLAAPFIGAVDERLKSPKTILLMCCVIKLIGQVLYAIPVNEYFPLFGRILSGIGEGTSGVIYGAVAQATNDKNRAQAFLYFEGLFCIGSSLGPVVGAILTFHANVYGWIINVGNSPGVVLALVWLFLLIYFFWLPSNLALNSPEFLESGDSSSIPEHEWKTSTELSSKRENKEYSFSRICCLFFILFQGQFMLNLGLVYTLLFAVKRFGLNITCVRLYYTNIAFTTFVLFLGSYVLSKIVAEKNFFAMGVVSRIVPILILGYFGLGWEDNHSIGHAYLLLVVAIFASFGFVLFPLTCSVISKEAPINSASLYQSIAFSVLHLSILSGRVVAGATFSEDGLVYVAVGLFITWVFELIWLSIEYGNIYPALKK